MFGGGNRRDEGSMPIQNTNLFAALDTRKKKKKSDKAGGKSKGSSSSRKEPEPQVFWAPTPLKAKAWADIDSDDEDDDSVRHFVEETVSTVDEGRALVVLSNHIRDQTSGSVKHDSKSHSLDGGA